MEEKLTQQPLTEQSTELKKISIGKSPKRQNVIIYLLAIFPLILFTTSALLLNQNNILKKRINEFTKITTSDDNASNADEIFSPTPTSAKSNNTTNQNQNLTHSQVDSCSSESCLFIQERGINIGTPEGYGKIHGYYFEYEADDWGTPTTCTGFVVKGGNETLIEHLNDMIKRGNSLNKRIDGKLVTNIYIEGLDERLKSMIVSSTENSQVTLGVVRRTPEGGGASTCTGIFEIVSAK